MKGWTVDHRRLRSLREEAELRAVDIAERIRCHHNHYRKFERGTAQPSAVLANAIVRVLSDALGRTVTLAEFADQSAGEVAA